MNTILKTCIDCRVEKSREDDFYKAGDYCQSRCKPCHKKYNTIKGKTREKKKPNEPRPRPKGVLPFFVFNKLSDDVKEDIKQQLKDKINMNVIVKKYDIKYTTFCKWVKDGFFN